MIISTLLDIVRWTLFGISHTLGGSVGLGIIGLSVLTRLAILPWTLRAARKGAAMQASMKQLEPKIRALKERYARDPARLRDAIIAEYRTAGLNPLGGMSLGLLAVQIPLGWAVYTVVSTGVGAGDAFLWISSLARPDAAISIVVGGLSTLMGATMSSSGGPASPTMMAAIMGLASGLIVFHMSAGVGLYWASTSTVGIVQNVLIRRSRKGVAG